MTTMRALCGLSVLAVAACASEPTFCEGPTRFDYDPTSVSADLSVFPDDFYSVPDPATHTGIRVKVDGTNAGWLGPLPTALAGVFEDLNRLDGFGTTAGVTVRFSGPLGAVPSGEAESLASKAMQLWELSDPPTRVPFEVRRTDDDATVILWPMRPLKPKTRHAAIVTTEQLDASNHCISPSKNVRALLTGENVPAIYAGIRPEWAAMVEALKLDPARVSAATVFTTQSIVEDTAAVAADVTARSFAWKDRPTCTDPGENEPFRACRGTFLAGDYRKDGVVADGTVQATYELPVAIFLPKTGHAPYPVTIFGHGLGAEKEQGSALAELAAPLGFATVAIDAPSHGEHPTSKRSANKLATILDFFGADAEKGSLQALVLRDHWREATYDKLQLVRLLQQAPDLDGDGAPELDTLHLAYHGVSLGGIMGPEFLANSAAIPLAILTVPGGRVASIISEAPQFSLVIEVMKPPGTPPGDVDRFFPIMQTLLEKGDSANWAPRVLENRLDSGGSRAPHLLFQEVIDDDTVPNVCNHALARAFGVPQLAPVVKPVGLVPVLEEGPVSGNFHDVTAAMFQFDRVTRHPGEAPQKATHSNVGTSLESFEQSGHFMTTWLERGTPEIVDPYLKLGTPPLAPGN